MMATGPSEKTRREVFERDNEECQFWHAEPVEATEISHMIHQGPGGLPPEHELNQPGNLAASCAECHRRFPPNGRWRWREFVPPFETRDAAMPDSEAIARIVRWRESPSDPAWSVLHGEDPRGVMLIESPSGVVVPETDLWFYNRWTWLETQERFQRLRGAVASERCAALESAAELRWLKEHGLPAAVNNHNGYLPIAAELGLSSKEAKRRIRVAAVVAGMGDVLVSIDVLDKIRKVPEEELAEIAGWFAELPPAEAWERYRNRFPDTSSGSNYTAIVGEIERVEQFKAMTTDDAADYLKEAGVDPALLMRGSSIVKRKGGEDE